MPDKSFALSRQDVPPSDADYDAIHSGVMESERGRWFLIEYARRNRHADTEILLAAIGRVEMALLERHAASPSEPTPAALLREAIAAARTNLSAIKPDGTSESKAGIAAIAPALKDVAARIRAAIEHVQEVAWSMRDQGEAGARCDILDQQIADIARSCAMLDALQEQIEAAGRPAADMDARAPVADTPGEAAANEASAAMETTASADEMPDPAMEVAPPAQTSAEVTLAGPAAEAAAVALANAATDPKRFMFSIWHPLEADATGAAIPGHMTPENLPPESLAPEHRGPQGLTQEELAQEEMVPEEMVPEHMVSESMTPDRTVPHTELVETADASVAEQLEPSPEIAEPDEPVALIAALQADHESAAADMPEVLAEAQAVEAMPPVPVETFADARPAAAVHAGAEPANAEPAAHRPRRMLPRWLSTLAPPLIGGASERVENEVEIAASADTQTGAADSVIDVALFEAELLAAPAPAQPSAAAESAGLVAGTAQPDELNIEIAASPVAETPPPLASLFQADAAGEQEMSIDQETASEPGADLPSALVASDAALGETFAFKQEAAELPVLPEGFEPASGPADFLLEPWPRVSANPATADTTPAEAASFAPPAAPDIMPDRQSAQPAAIAAALFPPVASAAKPAPWPMSRPAPNDPLAPIVGLSEEEKIALFS